MKLKLHSPRRIFRGHHGKGKAKTGGGDDWDRDVQKPLTSPTRSEGISTSDDTKREHDGDVVDTIEEWTGVVTLLDRPSSKRSGDHHSASIHVRVGTESGSSDNDDAVNHFRSAQHVFTDRTATTAASTVTAVDSSTSLASLDVSSSSALSASIKNALLAPPNKPVAPTDWGFPGFLTANEYETLVKFQSWYETSIADKTDAGKYITDAIFSFGPDEEYYHALCRWLRARKFVLGDTIAMVKEAVAERTEGENAPIHYNFYPSAKEALGVEEAIYKSQYPQLLSGKTTKDGKVLFFSKPGRVNINGLELVSTPAGVNKYQWSAMHHKFASNLRDTAKRDPSFIRYQSCVVMDLEGLSRATCNSRVLSIVQHQSRVDALCYPEILGQCLIINAPSFFSVIWTVIRRWLDARTAGKIEIYSSKAKAEKRLKELISLENLPKEYGGMAPTVDEMILQQDSAGNADTTGDKASEKKRVVKRRVTKLLHVKGQTSISIHLDAGETMEAEVFTRSVDGAKFTMELLDDSDPGNDKPAKKHHDKNKACKDDGANAHTPRGCLDSLPHPHIPHPHIGMPHLPHFHRKHNNVIEAEVRCPIDRAHEESLPYYQTIGRDLYGPGEYRIVGESLNKSKDYHLVVCNVFHLRTDVSGSSIKVMQ